MGVSKTPSTTFCSQPARTVSGQVLQKLSRGAVKDLSTNRNSYCSILAFAPGTVRAFSMPSAIGDVQRVISKMEEGVKRAIGYDPNIASASAVTSRRPAPRDKLLPAKSSYAISPMAALYSNPGAINKHINRKRRRALSL